MDEAFVEHTKHDIQGYNGREDENGLGLDGISKELGVALEAAKYIFRNSEGRAGVLDDGLCLGKGMSLGEVKGDSDCGELSLVVYRKRAEARTNIRHALQRHKSVPSRQVDLFQRFGCL